MWYLYLILAVRGFATFFAALRSNTPFETIVDWDMIACGLDAIPIVVITIWITTVMGTTEVSACRQVNYMLDEQYIAMAWWNFVLWVYTVLLILFWSCAGCWYGVMCYRYCSNRDSDGKKGKPPGIKTLLMKINGRKKSFGDLSEKSKWAKTCAICCEDFKDDTEVSELKCDERHVFCTTCLSEWMKQNNVCPLCKTEVKAAEL